MPEFMFLIGEDDEGEKAFSLINPTLVQRVAFKGGECALLFGGGTTINVRGTGALQVVLAFLERACYPGGQPAAELARMVRSELLESAEPANPVPATEPQQS